MIKLRLCAKDSCTVKPHYENCHDCLGFGFNNFALVNADSAELMRGDDALGRGMLNGASRPCPTCGSDYRGPKNG